MALTETSQIISETAEKLNTVAESTGGHHYGAFYENPEFWVGLAFIFVIIALARPVGRILSAMIHKRIDDIKTRLDDSAGLLENARKLLAEYETKYRNAEKEASEILEKSQKQIDYIKTEQMSRLEQEMRNKEKDAEERLNSGKENADKEFTETAATLSIKIARQTILDNLSAKTQDKLIEESIRTIGSLR